MATRSASTPDDTATATRSRKRVELPQSVEGVEADWPISVGRASKNAGLREQIATDLESMDTGSVRRYDIAGDREQKAFVNQYRSVLKAKYGDEYGIKAAHTDGAVYIKLVS